MGTKICSIVGCGKVSIARGYCKLHWQRWRNGTPMSLPVHFTSLTKTGWVHKGYRWISVPGRGEVMEHRYKMEQFLGRRLHVDEVVHHRNDDKLDNRLCNLEVKPRAQHTAEHRGHRSGRCLVCTNSDYHGTRGLCGMHANRIKRAVKHFGLNFGSVPMGRALAEMGLALALEDDEVAKRIQLLFGDGAK